MIVSTRIATPLTPQPHLPPLSSYDSLRFYFLGKEGRRRIEHIGAKPVTDLDAPLIV